MFHVRKIESFDLPELEPYRTMRRQLEQRQKRLFVAEGEKVVRRLLESRFEVVSLLIPERWLSAVAPLLERRAEDIPVFVGEKELLETLTGFSMYQGLLATGRVPAQEPLEQLLARTAEPKLLVAVEGLSNAENLGSIVRCCAAFGVDILVVGETSSSPFLRRAVRSSMGTIFELPVFEAEHLLETLRVLKERGIVIVGAHPHAPAERMSRGNLARSCCIVLGSEGQGLSPDLLALCDQALSIPMARTVDSLNVAGAAAVFLYEAARQRGKT